jgi:serine/threonine-protein kinase HipA
MSFAPTTQIQVVLWARRVGQLAPDPEGFFTFSYDPDWLSTGIEFAPLTMPLGTGRYVFPELPEHTYRRLPAAIADALPDRFGSRLVAHAYATRGLAKTMITGLDRLAFLGDRGMGALEFRPDHGPTGHETEAETPSAGPDLDLPALVSIARATLRGRIIDPQLAGPRLNRLVQLGTSAGGARAKIVVNWKPGTEQLHSGVHQPAPGFEPWLLKFDGMGRDTDLGTESDYGRVEYAYSLMARAAGIQMNPTALFEENGRAHFMTKRFDRTADGTKLHIQTLCGAAELDFNVIGTNSSDSLFTVSEKLGLGVETRQELFRRIAFNVGAANCDDHSKNWSFLMDQNGNWSLAPAYDITHAFNPDGYWNRQHLISVQNKFLGITASDLLDLAHRFEVPQPAEILNQVRTAIANWPDFAAESGVGEPRISKVAADFTIADW